MRKYELIVTIYNNNDNNATLDIIKGNKKTTLFFDKQEDALYKAQELKKVLLWSKPIKLTYNHSLLEQPSVVTNQITGTEPFVGYENFQHGWENISSKDKIYLCLSIFGVVSLPFLIQL